MDDTKSSRQMIGTLVFILIGPILWALHLTVTYGAQSSLCAFDAASETFITGMIIGSAAVFIGLIVLAMLQERSCFALLTGTSPSKEQWPFLKTLMKLLGALSILGMVYFSLASLILPACAQLR
jgi:hypothetical protein